MRREGTDGAGLLLPVSAEALRPLLRELVAEAVAQLQAHQAAAGDKVASSEAEAARLLGVNEHVLRDERLRGRIAASQIVGRRIRYTRQDLLDYLMARRTGGLSGGESG